ncbi:MAG: ATPase, T2SS/T4P/T4SS family [Vampirovibrionales bacterium]|nr:ATPase, T2SS/T4P/T4SS family [Vampirovibrionales bacterium]
MLADPSKNTPPISQTAQPARKRLGEVLIDMGLVTEADMKVALVESKEAGVQIGEILVKKGKITREDLGAALGRQFGLRYVNISEMVIDKQTLELLPDEIIHDKQVIPITNASGRLVVAMVDPNDRTVIDEITFVTGMRPLSVVTTQYDFQQFYKKHLSNRSADSLLEVLSANDANANSGGQLEMLRQEQEASDPNNPLVKLVNSLLEEAIAQGASDVHAEPRKDQIQVRFRTDGILKTILTIPQSMEASFITRIKVMAKLDIAEHRRPQDGRITLKYRGTEYNLRVNTMPVSVNREKIVIRILRPSKNITSFAELGFDEVDTEKLEYLYSAPYGIVLVSGPTGSGKTTTLYTMLHQINSEDRNIATVEDPIELTIEGLNQSQVNTKADFTFASSLRALLRQDPDVIMVGEIRDEETLEAAIHAALTGHLVFSTIHSNTTSASVTRMVQMGAPPNLVASALRGVIAQRLVRTLCSQCKEPYEASETHKQLLLPYDKPAQQNRYTLYKAKGCELCGGSGYTGRCGLYEIMVVDRELRQMIGQSRSDLELEDTAVNTGMKTLAAAGREKVLEGITSIDEVTRVLGPTLGD